MRRVPGFHDMQDIDHGAASYAVYRRTDDRNEVADLIVFTVEGDKANAQGASERYWTGTKAEAVAMAEGLLEAGYVLDRNSVHRPNGAFPPKPAILPASTASARHMGSGAATLAASAFGASAATTERDKAKEAHRAGFRASFNGRAREVPGWIAPLGAHWLRGYDECAQSIAERGRTR